MEPFVFVLAWLAYVAIFWLTVFWFDRGQEGSPGNWLNKTREILTVSLRARPQVCRAAMIPECPMDSSLSLLLISLIGVAAFAFGFLAGRQRRKQGANHG